MLALLMTAGIASAWAQAASADTANDETTMSVDNTRGAWKSDQAGLSPATLPSIHEVFRSPVAGQVLAQPLVVGSTVIVATENDWVYGIDRNTGDEKWARSVGNPEPSSAVGCTDIDPRYGVTSTPVFDPETNSVYVSARTWDGSNVASAQQRIFALNPSTGAVQPGWPVVVQGTASNDSTTGFNPVVEFQRPGLLLLDHKVWAAFASMCDLGDYRGWVTGVSTTSRAQTRWVDEANPGGGEANIGGGIWQSGGGLASDPDRPNSIFFASGNGTVPPVGAGTTPANALGQSVVRLQEGSNGTLSQADHFAPFNADTLNSTDRDLGSSAPIMLPDNFGGVTGHPHLALQGSKQGMVYLLDRDHLGGRAQGTGGKDAVVAEVNGGAAWSHPAVWPGDGGYLYITQAAGEGTGLPLQAYRVGGGTNPTLSVVGHTTDKFGWTTGSPVITSDGTTSGSALLWVIDRLDNDHAELRAYNPVPDAVTHVIPLLWKAPVGAPAKFSVPATAGNQVFVGTNDGHLVAFSAAAPQCTTFSGHQVCGAIRDKYLALGGPAGFLGPPTTDETVTPDGIGRFNHFANAGSIYWTPSTGAWSIHGGIRAKWASLGWELSFLGYPVTDETGAPDGIGRFNHFSSVDDPNVVDGSIYWTPNTGAVSIHGLIRAKYQALGGPASPLGYPVTDELGTPDGIGRFNHFTSMDNASAVDGSIYWTRSTGAWSIHGGIRAKWASLGWERSVLGYPVTDETGAPDGIGRFNDFTSTDNPNFVDGSIYWTPKTGPWSIHGFIRAKYQALGGPSFLGYPVTDETGTPDGIGRFNHFTSTDDPTFVDGSIYWTPSTGAWSVRGSIRARWASMGWETSCLGYPVSDEFAIAGGRQSNFQRGVMTYDFATARATPSC